MAGENRSIARDYPSEKNCSLRISGTEEEVLEAAAQHAVSAHGHDNTPELRSQLRSMLKEARD
jgi:predicted small metal-binding protein